MAGGSEAFWRNPPWQGGRPPFRMGLAPIDEAQWLAEPIDAAEHARKRELLARRRSEVLAELPAWQAAVEAVAEDISDRLARRGFSSRPPSGLNGLARAALLVPDDLCVLAPSPQGYRLVSACLCSPSYWRLGEKIGKPVPGLHAPVRGLEDAIGKLIARFLDNLPVGQIFARRNWNLHRQNRRFHPDPENWTPPPAANALGDLFMRSEYQTLRKFDGGLLLFTIGVSSHRLAGIAGHRDALQDLLRAIERMSPDERLSFGYPHHGEALRRYLESLLED